MTQDVVIYCEAVSCNGKQVVSGLTPIRPSIELKGIDVTVERTVVNPWTWSAELRFNQGEIVSGHIRTLYCSGQTAMNSEGKPQYRDDMAAQLGLCLDNLETVLGEPI